MGPTKTSCTTWSKTRCFVLGKEKYWCQDVDNEQVVDWFERKRTTTEDLHGSQGEHRYGHIVRFSHSSIAIHLITLILDLEKR